MKMCSHDRKWRSLIKLNATDDMLDFEEARKYQDVEKIYGKYVDKDNPTADDAWKNEITFFHDLAKDKKFTNQFKYFDYDLSERINGSKAEVVFKSKDPRENIQSITYLGSAL